MAQTKEVYRSNTGWNHPCHPSYSGADELDVDGLLLVGGSGLCCMAHYRSICISNGVAKCCLSSCCRSAYHLGRLSGTKSVGQGLS